MCDDAARVADAADAAALDAFNSVAPQQQSLSADVRAIIAEIAGTGLCRHDWARVKPAVRHLLCSALRGEEAPGSARAVDGEWYTDALDGFTHEPPFTLQRLCELLLDPGKHYSAAPKLAHALDKLLCVTSTVPSGADALRAAARTHQMTLQGGPPAGGTPEESMAVAAEGPAESVGASLAAPLLEAEPRSHGQP